MDEKNLRFFSSISHTCSQNEMYQKSVMAHKKRAKRLRIKPTLWLQMSKKSWQYDNIKVLRETHSPLLANGFTRKSQQPY